MVDPARAVKTEASYQDVLDAPRHKVAEIIDGELYLSPRPGTPHTRAVSQLHLILGAPFDRGHGGPGGWFFLVEPELHFGSDIVVPDIAAWRRENLPRDLNGPFITDPPDWICEGLSRSTVRLDRGKKMPLYAKVGIGHAWLVDPIVMNSVEVYRLEDKRYELVRMFHDSEPIRAEPFDAIELQFGEIWTLPNRAGEEVAVYSP
jgi:Uma2 family endonuclease